MARDMAMENTQEDMCSILEALDEPPNDMDVLCSLSLHILNQCIEDLRSVLDGIGERMPSCDEVQLNSLIEQVRLAFSCLSNDRIPKEIELPKKGSISQIQGHVMATQLGLGQNRVTNEDAITFVPTQPPRQMGVLRKKHQRIQKQVRFAKKTWCTAIILAPRACRWMKKVDPEEAKRSRLKPFIQVVNYNHIMPNKYTLDADLKNAVVPEKLDAKAKRVK
ncbi:hypothetical protein L7F22_067453 [Adiantum nelumboides]|nr:hypothetical protein [Adiantum nelumboides]